MVLIFIFHIIKMIIKNVFGLVHDNINIQNSTISI